MTQSKDFAHHSFWLWVVFFFFQVLLVILFYFYESVLKNEFMCIFCCLFSYKVNIHYLLWNEETKPLLKNIGLFRVLHKVLHLALRFVFMWIPVFLLLSTNLISSLFHFPLTCNELLVELNPTIPTIFDLL